MRLEKAEPLEIRAHNAERMFYEWQDTPLEERGERAVRAGYTEEFAANLTDVCRELFEYNRQFKITRSLDALCAKCTGEKREAKCELQEPDFEIRGMKAVFGDDIEVGGTYTPLEMTERAMSYVKREIGKKEMLLEKYRDNILLETQKKRLAGLEFSYEKLKQLKGETI